MSCWICSYVLMNFKKLMLGILIAHYGLQTLKVSCDLEIVVYKVVEIPWKYPFLHCVQENPSIKNIFVRIFE